MKFLIFFFIIFTNSILFGKNIQNSVVKIYVISSSHNYYEPWKLNSQIQSSGSGFIIEGNKILTNAHVVADAKFIQVKKPNNPKKYTAKVDIVAHECDLAIITIDDTSFFDNTTSLKFAKSLQTREKVEVYGYPIGGEKLSITEGVVSRIEQRIYAHSGATFLSCQIDAAINYGNSGGPVLRNNEVVGVAFQSAGKGQNIGYIIPIEIINHFLHDIKDKKYNGFPELPIDILTMESNSLKEYYNFNKNKSGVLVRFVDPTSFTSKYLKKDDIILSINGVNIFDDATIKIGSDSYDLSYIVQKSQIGDKIQLNIFRDKKIKQIEFKLKDRIKSYRLVSDEQYDTKPQFFITGGLVFTNLTKNYLKEWGQKWYYTAPTPLLYEYFYGEKNINKKEIVILSKVLPDEVNIGYHNMGNLIIEKVNGQKISTLKDLIKKVGQNRSKFNTFESKSFIIVLNRKLSNKNNPIILKKFNIPSDRFIK